MATASDSGTVFRESTTRNMLQKNGHGVSNTGAKADSDVKLWLQYTGFYDTEHRQKILGALQELKAIDEQRKKLISEIQSATPYFILPATSVTPQSPAIQEAYLPSISVVQKADRSALSDATNYNPLLDLHVTAVPSSHKFRGPETPLKKGKGADSDSGYMAVENRSVSSQQHDASSPMSSVRYVQPTVEDDVVSLSDLHYDQWKTDSPQMSNESVETEASPLSKNSHMGRSTPTLRPKRGTRYFLVKSFNVMNVELSQRDGLWITKAKNGPILANAFRQHESVYLIFSINKSRAFQGYARMTTAPRADIPAAKWMNNIDWEASDPFRVEWLNTRRTEFWKLGDLKNAFNDGAPVFVGRDGQEYPEECGRKMIEVMDRGGAGEQRQHSVSSSWSTQRPWNDAGLAEFLRKHRPRSWREAAPDRFKELSDAGEPAEAEAEAGFEPADDMPLIDY